VGVSVALKLIIKNNFLLQNVFEIKIDSAISKKRVIQRSRGSEDNTKVFEDRLEDYNYQMKDIRLYYKDIFIEIEGNLKTSIIVDNLERKYFTN
jgi:adenylate kinase family enzyme